MHYGRNACRARAGFTLLELMVVIGIIGVLAVALMPAITNALTRSEAAETTARMTMLSTAAKAFESEYGFFPPDNYKSLAEDRIRG